MSQNRGGDVLARGGARAQFRASESSVSQKKWNLAFGVNDKDAGAKRKKKSRSKR